jgi:hypothetical protein
MSEWTVITLKEHLEKQIDHVKELKAHDLKSITDKIADEAKYTAEQFRGVREAVTKAEEATEKRLGVLNELRAVVTDQGGTFITRDAAEAKIGSNSKDIATLQGRLDKIEGRGSGLNAGWGYLVGAIGLAAIVIEAIRAFH